MAPDVPEIRRMLQVFDQSSNLPPRQAVGLLEKITAQVAASPATYDLMDDPADCQAWMEAGGDSFCENQEFPGLLFERWMEVLSKPDFGNAGFDKDELDDLKCDIQDWVDALGSEGKGFELGDTDGLLEKLDALIEAAPEPEEESD